MTVKENEKEIVMIKEMMQKIYTFLFGNGDKIGLDENFRELVRRMGVVESNTKEALDIARKSSGFAGVIFDEDSHPGRREGDKPQEKTWLQRAWDKTTENLFDKFVTAVIIIILVNIPDIFQKFLELAK